MSFRVLRHGWRARFSIFLLWLLKPCPQPLGCRAEELDPLLFSARVGRTSLMLRHRGHETVDLQLGLRFGAHDERPDSRHDQAVLGKPQSPGDLGRFYNGRVRPFQYEPTVFFHLLSIFEELGKAWDSHACNLWWGLGVRSSCPSRQLMRDDFSIRARLPTA